MDRQMRKKETKNDRAALKNVNFAVLVYMRCNLILFDLQFFALFTPFTACTVFHHMSLNNNNN